jgi:predicted dehydrogenase
VETGSLILPAGVRHEAGGGILLDHGTHPIYQLLDLPGMPATL